LDLTGSNLKGIVEFVIRKEEIEQHTAQSVSFRFNLPISILGTAAQNKGVPEHLKELTLATVSFMVLGS
jgi:hypothetical protein